MHCGGCLKSVERAAMGVPGVSSARASLAAKRVAVSYDAKLAGEADLIAALEGAGFAAAPIEFGGAFGRHRTAKLSAPPRRGRGLCRDEHHAAFGVGVGRKRRRHGRQRQGAVLVAVGVDRAADRGLCRTALLQLRARRAARTPAQYGCADLARHHSGDGDERLSDHPRRRSGLLRRRGVVAVPVADRPVSR